MSYKISHIIGARQSNSTKVSETWSAWTHLRYVKFHDNPLTIKRNIAKMQEPVFFGSPCIYRVSQNKRNSFKSL